MKTLLHFLIAGMFVLSNVSAQTNQGLIVSANGNLSTGYSNSISTNYSAGFGYDIGLGYLFGNTGLGLMGQFGKTHFESERYSYYVPGYYDSWGNEIWYATHINGVLRWGLPFGAVRPYVQGMIGTVGYRYKDKILVEEEVWDEEEQEWTTEKSVFASSVYSFGRASKLGYAFGALIQTGDNVFIDLQIEKSKLRDKDAPATWNSYYNTLKFSVGVSFVLGD